ncbi:hypothetical protein IHE45_01G017400 [Dioscorea alata]|uniref:Uncharacterized protein n=1 Tax=Dioscorea alata TaxID=55571 RepID=A0ACB7WT54_DIOAL|nr:hypothetical protein IHE45_01G017400 [Dioscorea alata]
MEISNGGNIQNGVEKLVGTNYKYWRMCMEAHLQGQDLWELVWKIKNGKALFALRTSISKEFIDHVRDLATLKQEGMWILEYFLQVKSICAEISEIDVNEKISEALLRSYLIRGLRKEYGPFITSIQGWPTQPSVVELENLLFNQEALAKQMTKSFESDAVFFSRGKANSKNTSMS